MDLQSISFANVFHAFPPLEAISKCNNLPGYEDVCNRISSWKAYIAKRFSRKRSVQRPDLLLASEWIEYAKGLERASPPTIYIVTLNNHDEYGLIHHYGGSHIPYDYFMWEIEVYGIPFMIRPDHQPVIYISDFQLHMDPTLYPDIYKSYLDNNGNDIYFFESVSFSIERCIELLEILLPKISNYIELDSIVTSTIPGPNQNRAWKSYKFISLGDTITLLRSMSSVKNGSLQLMGVDDEDSVIYINWWPVELDHILDPVD